MAGSLCCLSHSANLSWFIAWLFGGLQEADSQLSAPPNWNFWSKWKQNVKKKFLKANLEKVLMNVKGLFLH